MCTTSIVLGSKLNPNGLSEIVDDINQIENIKSTNSVI